MKPFCCKEQVILIYPSERSFAARVVGYGEPTAFGCLLNIAQLVGSGNISCWQQT
jgi:hypothetical protein